MILYRKYQDGGLRKLTPNTEINLPAPPEIEIGKFTQPKDIYGMTIHKVPKGQQIPIEHRANREGSTFADTYRKRYEGATDGLWQLGKDYYSGNVREELPTGIMEVPETPSLFINGTEKPGTTKYYNTNTAEDMSKEAVDDYIFRKYYDNTGTTKNLSDYYRKLYNEKLQGAKRIY